MSADARTRTIRLGWGDPADATASDDGCLWVPLSRAAKDLGWHLTDLGGGRVGVCPDPEVCVPVPEESARGADGSEEIDLTALAEPLGLVVAQDHRRTAVVTGARPPAPSSGSAADIRLPDVWTDRPAPIVEEGRRSCVFAWASW